MMALYSKMGCGGGSCRESILERLKAQAAAKTIQSCFRRHQRWKAAQLFVENEQLLGERITVGQQLMGNLFQLRADQCIVAGMLGGWRDEELGHGASAFYNVGMKAIVKVKQTLVSSSNAVPRLSLHRVAAPLPDDYDSIEAFTGL